MMGTDPLSPPPPVALCEGGGEDTADIGLIQNSPNSQPKGVPLTSVNLCKDGRHLPVGPKTLRS